MIQGDNMIRKTTHQIELISSEMRMRHSEEMTEDSKNRFNDFQNKQWISLEELITLIDDIVIIPKSKRELLSYILT